MWVNHEKLRESTILVLLRSPEDRLRLGKQQINLRFLSACTIFVQKCDNCCLINIKEKDYEVFD